MFRSIHGTVSVALKGELAAQLHVTSSRGASCDHAKAGAGVESTFSVGIVGVSRLARAEALAGGGQVGMIESIVGLYTELEGDALGDMRGFEERHVDVSS